MNLKQLKEKLKEKEREAENLKYPDCMGNWKESQGEEEKVVEAEISALMKGIEAVEQRDKEILEIGDKIFYSKNYGNEDIDNDKFSYAIELWKELKQQLTKEEQNK